MTLSLHLIHKNNVDNIPSHPVISVHCSASTRVVAARCVHDTPIPKLCLPIRAKLLLARPQGLITRLLNLSHARPTLLDIDNPH